MKETAQVDKKVTSDPQISRKKHFFTFRHYLRNFPVFPIV